MPDARAVKKEQEAVADRKRRALYSIRMSSRSLDTATEVAFNNGATEKEVKEARDG